MDALWRWLLALVALINVNAMAARAPHHDDTALVQIPAIEGEWQAIRGGQAAIDAGHVVIFEGEPCEHLHLAGHHSTHGAVFARLPSLRPGDTVSVYASVGCTYRIDRVENYYSTVEPPYGDLLIQTSLPGGFFLGFGSKV